MQPPLGTAERPLVLVIDDDEALRAVLAEVLTWLGCRVATSADGWSLGEAVAGARLALVDWHLAQASSRQLVDALDRVGVPVVCMSGDERAATQMGGRHAFLPKPFDLEVLRGHIQRWTTGSSPAKPPKGSQEEEVGSCRVGWSVRCSSAVAPILKLAWKPA